MTIMRSQYDYANGINGLRGHRLCNNRTQRTLAPDVVGNVGVAEADQRGLAGLDVGDLEAKRPPLGRQRWSGRNVYSPPLALPVCAAKKIQKNPNETGFI